MFVSQHRYTISELSPQKANLSPLRMFKKKLTAKKKKKKKKKADGVVQIGPFRERSPNDIFDIAVLR